MRALKVVAFLAVTAASIDARAWLHVCNHTPNTIWVAYADRRQCGFWTCGETGCGTGYHLRGWYRVEPNTCAAPNYGDQTYFSGALYAEDAVGHVWSGWDPAYSFCTPWSVFNYCDSGAACGEGSRRLTYWWIPNISYDNFTVNYIL